MQQKSAEVGSKCANKLIVDISSVTVTKPDKNLEEGMIYLGTQFPRALLQSLSPPGLRQDTPAVGAQVGAVFSIAG